MRSFKYVVCQLVISVTGENKPGKGGPEQEVWFEIGWSGKASLRRLVFDLALNSSLLKYAFSFLFFFLFTFHLYTFFFLVWFWRCSD